MSETTTDPLDPNVAAAQARQVQVNAMVGDSAARELGQLKLAQISAEADAAVLRQQLAEVFKQLADTQSELQAQTARAAEAEANLAAAATPPAPAQPPGG